MELFEEGVERGDAGVRALASRGEDDALEIACAVGGGERPHSRGPSWMTRPVR